MFDSPKDCTSTKRSQRCFVLFISAVRADERRRCLNPQSLPGRGPYHPPGEFRLVSTSQVDSFVIQDLCKYLLVLKMRLRALERAEMCRKFV